MTKLLVVLVLAVGCATPSSGDTENEEVRQKPDVSEQSPQETTEVPDHTQKEPGDEQAETESFDAPIWSDEGLFVQPRMHQLEQHEYWEPETTSWRESERELPQRFDLDARGQGASSPGQLTVELVEELRLAEMLGLDIWEVTTRVSQNDDRATGAIMQWGWKDDAIAGGDFRVEMRRVDDRWYVERLEERFHCRRGITDGGDLCV